MTASPPPAGSATPYVWAGALDATLGAWLLGTFCGLILYGFMLYQSYHYFRLYPADSVLYKGWVLAVLLVETLNIAFTTHSSYFYLVANFDHSVIFNDPPIWTMNSIAITGPLAITITQGFFARRVYILAPRFRIVVYISIILLLGFCGCFLALAVKVFSAPNFFAQSLPLSGYVATGVVCVMVADIQLTAVLIHILRRNRTGLGRMDSLIDVLILYAVTTGLMNCVVNVLDIIFALCFPKTMIYTSFSITVTKLYSNSFLAALNARRSFMRRGPAGDFITSGDASSAMPYPQLSARPTFAPRRITLASELTSTPIYDLPEAVESHASAMQCKSPIH